MWSLWYDQDELHFKVVGSVDEFILPFGEATCVRKGHDVNEGRSARPIWMDTYGALEPFSKKRFANDKHVVGKRKLMLELRGFFSEERK